jgi:hypothetical protein
MPAATAEKRVRQCANKLLQIESEATTSPNAPPPSQAAEFISESLSTIKTDAPVQATLWLTPTPSSFTMTITNSPFLFPTQNLRTQLVTSSQMQSPGCSLAGMNLQ